MKIAVRRATFK